MSANKFVVCTSCALVVYLFILVMFYFTFYILVLFFFVFHAQNNLQYVQFLPHGKGSPTQLFLSPKRLSYSFCLTYSYLYFTNQRPGFSGRRLTPDPAVGLSYLRSTVPSEIYMCFAATSGEALCFGWGWDQIRGVPHRAPSCTMHCKPIH